MPAPTPIGVLFEREYLTPGQCARRFGRGHRFWEDAMDQGDLDGYVDGKHRHIRIESAKALLERIGDQRRYTLPVYRDRRQIILAAGRQPAASSGE